MQENKRLILNIKTGSIFRSGTSAIKIGSKRSAVLNKEPDPKREKACNSSEKMIDLDIVSSDEEDFWSI
jgi:hypothetical protein